MNNPYSYSATPCRLASRITIALLSAWLCAAGTPDLRAESDDFNGTNDLAWTHYNPLGGFGVAGVFSFPQGGYRIQTVSPSPAPAALGNGRTGSLRATSYTNFYLSVDLVDWDDSLPQAACLLARIGTPGLGTWP